MRRLAWIAVAAAVALLGQGCGGSGAPPPVAQVMVVGEQTAVTHEASAPPVQPPPALDVLMIGASDWVLVGTHESVGGEATGPAFVERTTDAGQRWSTVFSSSRAELWWVGRDGASVVVAGETYHGREGGNPRAVRALLLRSRDNGASFTATHPRVPHGVEWRELTRFAFSGRGAAIAVPQLDAGSFGGTGGVLRSGDDGASWTRVMLPGHGVADWGAAWTPNGREAFVTGHAEVDDPAASCGSALWRSTDAGARWQLVHGACGYFELGVAFLDARHGFMASGSDPKATSGQVVYATDDAGAHWHVAWRDREQYGESPIVSLQFVDRKHGWALPGYISLGANFRYLGDALSSSDGGRHWHDTGQLASVLSALPDGSALALVAVANKHAPELALTRDWGARWTQLTPLADVQTTALLGAPGTVADVTDAGDFLSNDGGHRWTRLHPAQLGLHSTLLAALPGLTASLDASDDRCALLLGAGDGDSWRTVAPPGGTLHRIVVAAGGGGGIDCPQQGMAFADPTRGVAAAVSSGSCGAHEAPSENVYTTGDGGLRWQLRRALPLEPTVDQTVAASGNTYVILADGDGGAPNCVRIAISRDGGRAWSVQALPSSQQCSGATAYAHEIWITCDSGERGEQTRGIVYHSSDAGRTWRVYTSACHVFAPVQIVATGPGRALASGGGCEAETENESLWRTEDGGATWTQSWPALPIGTKRP